jgi:hypothetical protein
MSKIIALIVNFIHSKDEWWHKIHQEREKTRINLEQLRQLFF